MSLSTFDLPAAIVAGDIDQIVAHLDRPMIVDQSANRSRLALANGCRRVIESKHGESHVVAFERILRHPNVNVNERITSKGVKKHIVMAIILACKSRRLLDALLSRDDLLLPSEELLDYTFCRRNVPTSLFAAAIQHRSFDDETRFGACIGLLTCVVTSPETFELLESITSSPRLNVNRTHYVDMSFGLTLMPYFGNASPLELCAMRTLLDRRFAPSMRAMFARADVEPNVVALSPDVVDIIGNAALLTKMILTVESYDPHLHARNFF